MPVEYSDLTFTSFVDEVVADGWQDVADRMDRWAANNYTGHWTDAQYESPAEVR